MIEDVKMMGKSLSTSNEELSTSGTVPGPLEKKPRERSLNPRQWTAEEVGEWLVENDFGQYRDIFVLNDVIGSILLRMDRESLTELVPSLGHRLSLLDKIEKISGPKTPRHVGEGMVGGVSGLANKLMFGFNHLVNDPIDGVSKEGVSGFMKGLGTGFSGAIQYPVEGVALFSKELGDGFRHTPAAIFGEEEEDEREEGDKAAEVPTVEEDLEMGKWGGGGGPEEGESALTRIAHLRASLWEGASQAGPNGRRPSHVGEGLLIGFQQLGCGIFDGVTGLVTEPMKAAASSAKESSANQSAAIARGVAKGITGALCKPCAGTFDFAASTVEGLIATPHALMEVAKDGPLIQETPTFKRLSSFRLPSADMIRERLGFAPQSEAAVVTRIEELRKSASIEGRTNVD